MVIFFGLVLTVAPYLEIFLPTPLLAYVCFEFYFILFFSEKIATFARNSFVRLVNWNYLVFHFHFYLVLDCS